MSHSGLRLVAGGATFGMALLFGTICAQAEPPSDRALSITWTDTQLNTTLNRVRFVDRRTGFAFGDAGKIVVRAEGGVTWQSRESNPRQPFYGAHFVDAQNGWAVGQAGNVVATADGGATWQSLPYKGRSTLRGVFFLDKIKG